MSINLTQLEIPITERRLANGLRVIVNEDHTSPIVAVHVMFRAGSRDERPGRTGLAHLLEHLLFEGSANCAKGEFDRLLENVGGSNNGSTWLDRTNYYEVVPSHAVELALWLERERMGFFLPVLDGEMLEVQRSVVINERRQVYENRPYGLAHERLHQRLFPADHPYSWPTIGYTADLEQISLDDARSFYTRFYAPSNAVIVLSGDIATERGFDLVERYFGDLGEPPSANGASAPAFQVETPGDVVELPDRVTFPRVYQAWSVPGYGTREWIALDVLAYLLADGDSSRLQRVLLREDQVAQQVDAYLYPTALAGIFGTVATARTGKSADDLTASLNGVLDRVIRDGVSDEEVEGAVRRARRDHLSGLSNVESRAEEIAYSTTVLDDPSRLEAMLNQYAEVEPGEIREAAARYLAPEQMASVVVFPDPALSNGR